MHGNIENASISGAPTIEFRFAGDTVTADLAGAHLYAEARGDDRCDLRVTDATGFVLANLVINERPERTMTENVMDIGSALLWSHWRWTEAQKTAATTPPTSR